LQSGEVVDRLNRVIRVLCEEQVVFQSATPALAPSGIQFVQDLLIVPLHCTLRTPLSPTSETSPLSIVVYRIAVSLWAM
jgi:hypothetical protein